MNAAENIAEIDVKTVAQKVEQLRLAMISGDEDTLKELSADQLTYGHSGGAIENQQEFIDQFVSGKSDFIYIGLSQQSIVINDLAIVRHDLDGQIQDFTGIKPVNLKVLLVWQKQQGQWKLLARQAVKQH